MEDYRTFMGPNHLSPVESDYWAVNPRRVAGGRDGKRRGHEFERELAKHLNLPPESVDGGNRTKVDIGGMGYGHKYGNISVKNPSRVHTQLFLTTSNSFLRNYDVPLNVQGFIGLFFGHPKQDELYRLCKKYGVDIESLDNNSEIRRQRILSPNIPKNLTSEALQWLNSQHLLMFRLLFEKGYSDWAGRVDTLAWAYTKDDVESVEYYPMEKLRELYLSSEWKVAPNGSTLWCMVDGKKLLHLQMKGSGQPKYISWGYHGMMFHLHSTCLKELS